MFKFNTFSIDNLLFKQNYTEEEIRTNIAGLKLVKPRTPLQVLEDEIKDKLPNKTKVECKKYASNYYSILSPEEKEKIDKKIDEDYTRLIKVLDIIEKYLIDDFYLYVETGEELYYQWCIKRAKIKGEDLTDARMIAQLNYKTMSEEEKEKWNELNKSHEKKLKEIQTMLSLKMNDKLELRTFFIEKMNNEENIIVSERSYSSEFNKFKRKKEKYQKFIKEFLALQKKKNENSLYYKLALGEHPVIVNTKTYYILEQYITNEIYYMNLDMNNAYFIDKKTLQKLKEKIFEKEENQIEFEYKTYKNNLINNYASFSNVYRDEIALFTIMTPKMLFYLKHVLDNDINKINDNVEKVNCLREKWEQLPQSEKDIFIKEHQKIKEFAKNQRINISKDDESSDNEDNDKDCNSDYSEETKKKSQSCKIKSLNN